MTFLSKLKKSEVFCLHFTKLLLTHYRVHISTNKKTNSNLVNKIHNSHIYLKHNKKIDLKHLHPCKSPTASSCLIDHIFSVLHFHFGILQITMLMIQESFAPFSV